MTLSSNINCNEKGKVNAKKTEAEKVKQEGTLSSHNLIPSNRPIEPSKILEAFEKTLEKKNA